MRMVRGGAAALLLVCAVPVMAEPLRDQLAQVSFGDRDKATALQRIEAVLAALGNDRSVEATILRATALGYRAKLASSRSDILAARKLYEAAIVAQPRNAEAQLGLGAWHLGVVEKAGSLLGRMFGASRAKGEAAFDRAVALGGDRAFYPGLAALYLLQLDPDGKRGRELAEQAGRAAAPTPLDRLVQRSTGAVLAQVRAGKPAEARALAKRLQPLGSIQGL